MTPLELGILIAGATLKGTLMLALAFVVTRALTNAPAAARHLVWSVAIVGVLAIPALSDAIPWKWEVLPLIESSAFAEVMSPGFVMDDDRAEGASVGAAITSDERANGPRASDARMVDARTNRIDLPVGGELGPEGRDRTEPSWSVAIAHWVVTWGPMIWLAGLGAVALRIASSFAAIRWMVSRGDAAAPTEWDDALASAQQVVGHTGRLRLVVSRLASIPFITGLWRPVIVLPLSSAAWDQELRRTVLLHELSHIKRRDALIHVLSQIACAVYWFNPLVWVAARRSRVECERACDDLVLNAGTRSTDYAEHLLSIVRGATPKWTPALALFLARRAALEERLLAILESDGGVRSLSRRSTLVIIASMALTVLPLSALSPVRCDDQLSTDRDVSCSVSAELREDDGESPQLYESAVAQDRVEVTEAEIPEEVALTPTNAAERTDAAAQTDLTGDWFFSLQGPRDVGSGNWILRAGVHVAQDDQSLTITLLNSPGMPIGTGAVDPLGVSLLWEGRFLAQEGDPADVRFSGTFEENSMAGSVEVEGVGRGRWSATRLEEGMWPPADAAARRRLERRGTSQLIPNVQRVQARAEALVQEQRDMEASMERLFEAGDGPGSDAGSRLFERKQTMGVEIAELEREIDRLTAVAQADEPEVAAQLAEAATTIRDDKLKERLRYSRGLIGIQDRAYMSEFEAETTRVVEELQEELERVVF